MAFVRGAPLTYLWLITLLITSVMARHLTRYQLHALLVRDSTNIYHLMTDPLEVLISSLLFIDGRSWTPYLLLFTAFLAPVEHWLGQNVGSPSD
ncbi:hypothetical protein MSTO_05310 [Mycobacterium stomatepiae]|uniref:Uncharacterized protein n=1 Tax=Mycobacterium stomatepiae TaxID=470076 RepID=A0A7I7Q2W4_9MYCO|nr:hypothetical protein MSTO_05310 [Mycobacterium stomatepiae]